MKIEDIAKGTIGVYMLTNPVGGIYVGSTICIRRRLRSYRTKSCRTQRKIFNSLITYGFDAHTFQILEICSIENLKDRERYYQEYYNVISVENLNASLVGTPLKSTVFSDETRKNISIRLTGGVRNYDMPQERREELRQGFLGEKNPNYGKFGNLSHRFGKELSESTRYKIRLSRVGAGKQEAKKVIDTSTGIEYKSIREVSKAFNLNKGYLERRLNGRVENNTNFLILNK